MAKVCDLCGRGALRGMRRSHSNAATVRYQELNLHTKRFSGVRRRICTSCLRGMHATRQSSN